MTYREKSGDSPSTTSTTRRTSRFSRSADRAPKRRTLHRDRLRSKSPPDEESKSKDSARKQAPTQPPNGPCDEEYKSKDRHPARGRSPSQNKQIGSVTFKEVD